MTKRHAPFTLIAGGDPFSHGDWTALLEEQDVRDALPQLRALARRMKPAANSALAVVAATEAAADPQARDSSCTGATDE